MGKVVQELLGKQQIQEPYRYGHRVSINAVNYYKIKDELWNRDEPNITKHKKEDTGRIKNDPAEQTKTKNFLVTCIHPLQSEPYILRSLCKIYTGQIAEKTVIVKEAVEIGKKEMSSFQSSLPEGSQSKTKKQVVTVKTPKKAKKKGCGGI